MVEISYNTQPPEPKYTGKWYWLYDLIKTMESGTWADVNIAGVEDIKEASLRAAASNIGKDLGYKIKVHKSEVENVYKIGKFV